MIPDLWRFGPGICPMNQNDRRHRIPRDVATKRDIDFNMVKFDYTNYCKTTCSALGIAKEEAKRERHATSPGRQFPQFAL